MKKHSVFMVGMTLVITSFGCMSKQNQLSNANATFIVNAGQPSLKVPGGPYKDGTYRVKSPADHEGYYSLATVTIEDNKIKEAYDSNPNLTNLLLYPYFTEAIKKSQVAWRQIISISVENGIPIPGFSSALYYYDSYRTKCLPARLIQAQRDFFGAHTYERVDKPRGQFFHTEWE